MVDVNKKKKDRFIFLKSMYESSDGNESAVFNMFEVGKDNGFSKIEMSQIVDYLINENLISVFGLGGTIQLTHWGIKEVEEALENPQKGTAHFLPVNIINIGSMSHSSLQQGTSHSVINQSIALERMDELAEIIEKVKGIQEELNLSNDIKLEMISEIQTLESQQKSPKPKSIIIVESLKTIRNIMEGIAGSILAPGVVEQINAFLQHF